MTTRLPTPPRREVLREQLLRTVDLLNRRCAGQILDGDIEDYVALHWLEWHGGSLRLTTVGENLCKQQQSLLGRMAPTRGS